MAAIEDSTPAPGSLQAVRGYVRTRAQSPALARTIYNLRPISIAGALDLCELAFTTSPLIVEVKNTKSKILACNFACAELYGATPAEICGTHAKKWVPNDWRRFEEDDRRVAAGGLADELWDSLEGADGRRHQLFVRSVPLLSPDKGTSAAVLKMSIDVTALLDRM